MDDFRLPDPALLAPIEAKFWTPGGAVPLEAKVVVRGSPITAEKFVAHAVRQAREHSFRGGNMASVSVDLVLPDWPVERILRHQLATYPRYATCEVQVLFTAGFEILATGKRPHADVVLPALGIVEARRFAALFVPNEARNPSRPPRR